MRSFFSNLGWLIRTVPVIAGAALLGGMIGGFAMFAIDSALTWEPPPQSRLDVRADNQTIAVSPQQTKPVRIVGGAIPDPSAGMSAPPPVQQPQPSSEGSANTAQSTAQIAPALLTPNPLGPASPLQPQTATAASSLATQPQARSVNQLPVPAPNAAPNTAPSVTSGPQQPRWPDALSRAHQNANAQQQTAPAAASAPAAQSGDRAANNSSGTDRNVATGDRAASTDNQDRTDSFRHSRHSRRHAWRYGGDDEASGVAAPSRRQQARGYDRLYDSYGNRRDRSYGTTRQQFYRDSDDQTAPPFEAARPRPEPFWGGGPFRRGDQDDD